MKKYLFNRVLRSIFSVIIVMLLSVVLIFSLYPLDKIIQEDENIDAAKKHGEDAAKIKTLEVLENYGYTEYVSLNDYCAEVIGDNKGPRYKTCIDRSDSNEYKQQYLKKYRDLGWEEIRLQEFSYGDNIKNSNADVVTRKIVEQDKLYEKQEGQEYKLTAQNKYTNENLIAENTYDLAIENLIGEFNLEVLENTLIELKLTYVNSDQDSNPTYPNLKSFKFVVEDETVLDEDEKLKSYWFKDGKIKDDTKKTILGITEITEEGISIIVDAKTSGLKSGKLKVYCGSKEKEDTSTYSGTIKAAISLMERVYEPQDSDFLYDKDGKTVVTINNITYFQRRTNPLLVFWSWISNLITLDTKNSVDNYMKYDNETETMLHEKDFYKLEFTHTANGQKNIVDVEYVVNENDRSLTNTEVFVQEVIDGETKEKKYLSVGGFATSADVSNNIDDKKFISNFTYDVTFNDVNDPTKGGYVNINVEFDDGTSEVLANKKINYFLDNNIPVYVGDDNYWYIGNTKTEITGSLRVNDFLSGGNALVERKIHAITFIEGTLERGYHVQLDEYGAPALTCEGCKYKYKIYFDNVFPYIHFNFTQFSLGESIFFDKGKDVINLLFDNQGPAVSGTVTYPTGDTQETDIILFHTCKFNPSSEPTTKQMYFVDNYTTCEKLKGQSSMIATSFIMGIFATMIAYFIGVPVGVLMSRYKDKVFDKISMVYIIVMFSVPSLAYIYFFQVIATSMFKLEVVYEYGKISTYILPIVSLSLGSIASMMMWTRRYMIDQGNSDYVKFARAKGLSESQIFFKHTLRNAIVPIAHGIPGSIIGAVAGALVTEQIYNVPGTGKLMVTAIQKYDNWIAIGLIFFYSVLGIISMILGDIVITLVDPRISFVDTGGRK